jgi:cytochrome c-type biogenesis protein CcmH/NrfF
VRGLLRAIALIVAALAIAVPAATAQESPQASLPDIEDEVMCTICGTTLQLANSPQAERQRAFINELISEGKDKEEIKAALVDEYGSEVLAVPSTEGFDLAAWIVPIAGIALGLTVIALAARRWRRERAGEAPGAGAGAIDPGDAERLRDDLRRYEA